MHDLCLITKEHKYRTAGGMCGTRLDPRTLGETLMGLQREWYTSVFHTFLYLSVYFELFQERNKINHNAS